MKPNKTRIIGITGGIATGKSTISNMIREEGFYVIDSDKVARAVVQKGSKGLEEIVRIFGNDLLNEDGTLDREKLGNIIFSDEEKRNILNDLLHPIIRESIIKKIEEAKDSEAVIFVDMPLLFESREELEESGIIFHEVWLAYADRENQILRLMERDNYSYDQAISRIDAQLDIEKKKKLADKIIDNSGSIENARRQVLDFLDEYR
ncbi:MAG: dephospho-CoA kinase [Bacillota bacterium]